MYSPRPKKSLGQNFLTSIPARKKMIEAGEVTSRDTVLEIGPGKGFLTEEILLTGANVVALEKDQELIPFLQEKFKSSSNFSLLHGDVLTFDPNNERQLTSTYKVVANIPYYITGAILSHFLAHKHKPTCMAVLVQKEVAERICAHNNKESLLSLSVKVYGTPKLFYKVNKGSFNPIPKVDSAILQIKDISSNNFHNNTHEATFFRLIHAAFAHKRKFALSNIEVVFKGRDIRTLFQQLSLSEKVRAEDVTLPVWLSLSLKLSTQ